MTAALTTNERIEAVDFSRRVRAVVAEDGGMENISEWASRRGLDRVAVTNWMSARHAPTYYYLRKFCMTLGVDANWLLGLTDERPERLVTK